MQQKKNTRGGNTTKDVVFTAYVYCYAICGTEIIYRCVRSADEHRANSSKVGSVLGDVNGEDAIS